MIRQLAVHKLRYVTRGHVPAGLPERKRHRVRIHVHRGGRTAEHVQSGAILGIVVIMLKVGPFELYSVVTGTNRLDGGAMFGVVPKVLWQDLVDVDESNRILLATRTLLAVNRSARRVFLVDTGFGTKWAPEKAARFVLQADSEAIPRALAAIGLRHDDVTDIVVTHLHFDHNGGLTKWLEDPGGPAALCYPNARHWIHQQQWQHAHHPHVRDRASYVAADFSALEDAGEQLKLVEGDRPAPPCEGVEWFVSDGHTPGQLLPVLGTGKERVLFVGDLVPTAAHLRLPWVMAYDQKPIVSVREREEVYHRCLNEGLMLAFPHDVSTPGVAIEGPIHRPTVVRALPL